MRQITKSELDQVLQQHKLWMKSGGVQGERADLREADLRRANLRWADLRGADLRWADLWGADLRGAEFSINISHCFSFYRAKFTSDSLPWLILHPQWAEMQKTVQITPV